MPGSLRLFSRILVAGSSGLLLLACRQSIPNPTGSCTAPNDGGRAGYHVPGSSHEWVPDCRNVLKREYWRVFAESVDRAYVIPRPDGAPELAPACADPEHELAWLLAEYPVCEQAAGVGQVRRINAMKLVDALELTHFLHTRLKFTVKPGVTPSIVPFPLPSDIIDACDLRPEANPEALQEICARERERLRHGLEIAFTYSGPGAVALASRLNELYGIPELAPAK